MTVASPFPANHGTPGSIREMAAAIAARGHEVHVVTYHFGEGPEPAGVAIHRIGDLGLGRKVVVGPTWAKPLQDLQMVFTLWRVIRKHRIDLIHAHNYEGALVGWLGKLLTGRPLLYNACNTMSDELGSYGFLPRPMANALARFLDWFVPRLPDVTVAISDDLARFLSARGVPARPAARHSARHRSRHLRERRSRRCAPAVAQRQRAARHLHRLSSTACSASTTCCRR